MMRLVFVALFLSLACASPGPVHAEDWPCWRGPRLDGSLSKNLPVTWSEKENIAWKAAVPGVGHSSPIVVGDRVFVTTCLLTEQQRVLICLDRRDGKKLWERVVLTAPAGAEAQTQ